MDLRARPLGAVMLPSPHLAETVGPRRPRERYREVRDYPLDENLSATRQNTGRRGRWGYPFALESVNIQGAAGRRTESERFRGYVGPAWYGPSVRCGRLLPSLTVVYAERR